MPGDFFNLYLHQNYIDFFAEVDDLVPASEFLSFADILGGDWNVRSFDLCIFICLYFFRKTLGFTLFHIFCDTFTVLNLIIQAGVYNKISGYLIFLDDIEH
jgi:hypothetical protein